VSALLSIQGMTLKFAGLTALDHIDLEIDQGSLVAVIGPNGAGKTSLFNCISGVYRPAAGSVTFDGTQTNGPDKRKRLEPHAITALGVARMFQNLAVFEQLTVLENLMLGRHYRMKSSWASDLLWMGRSRRAEVENREVVEEIIDFLHLERYRMLPAAIVPYGIRKRIELGRALAMEPKLLLLDEPAAGLNQEETEDMARYILDIKEQRGITQILIEHDLRFVLDLADKVAVLDFGKKIAEGAPEEVRVHPAVIEAYVGSEHAPTAPSSAPSAVEEPTA